MMSLTFKQASKASNYFLIFFLYFYAYVSYIMLILLNILWIDTKKPINTIWEYLWLLFRKLNFYWLVFIEKHGLLIECALYLNSLNILHFKVYYFVEFISHDDNKNYNLCTLQPYVTLTILVTFFINIS